MAAKTVEVNHYHHHAQQFFFVVFATATIDIAGERIVLQKNAPDGRKYSKDHKYKGDVLRPVSLSEANPTIEEYIGLHPTTGWNAR
ncbi:hypothetical protein [Lysinibacillus sp. NPDC093692]|uniref:hypothetical protein n=1 Tax=Lysinibacillus sp. NPDC093692 TaxID=3390578 RepID=UPI003CFFAB79